MFNPANALCPCCGDQGELCRSSGGRSWDAYCPTCGDGRLAPFGSGSTPEQAVDRWLAAAERAVIRGAA